MHPFVERMTLACCAGSIRCEREEQCRQFRFELASALIANLIEGDDLGHLHQR
ncbi:MAG: hypothetical protein QOI61_1093 [Actinomycetota bacterium]